MGDLFARREEPSSIPFILFRPGLQLPNCIPDLPNLPQKVWSASDIRDLKTGYARYSPWVPDQPKLQLISKRLQAVYNDFESQITATKKDSKSNKLITFYKAITFLARPVMKFAAH